MTLKSEIVPFIDGNGLVAPNLTNPHTRGSDNGTMFTSEHFIMLQKRGEATEEDRNIWEHLIRSCMPIPGLTVRAPGDIAVDAPDNIIAILAAAKVLNRPQVARDILNYGLRYLGLYEPVRVTPRNWSAFQFRQLQLVFAMLCASGQHSWWKFWHFPLALYSALVILVSCMNVPIGETDPRRLSWLLIQATKEDSILCRLASVIWYQRLYRDYGVSENAMKLVYGIYCHDNHPFGKYAVD